MTDKILVFDLDGTLVDTAPDLLACLNHSIGLEGLDPMTDAGFRPILGRGGREMIRTAYARQNRALADDTLERLYRLFLQRYADTMPGASVLYPGLLAALDRFEAAGFRFAICTNKTERLAKALIEGLRLTGRFAAICGADTFARAKPDPLHLTETIRMAGLPSADCAVMVGDSKTDVDVAKAAGVPVVAVTFGYTDRPVAEFEPSRVISSYDELTVDLAHGLIGHNHAHNHA